MLGLLIVVILFGSVKVGRVDKEGKYCLNLDTILVSIILRCLDAPINPRELYKLLLF